jgi:hypothetical protein
MKLSTESELFKNVKETYRLLRMEERIKIMDYLENRGLTIVRKSGNGGENYTNNGTLPKEYDLRNWIWVTGKYKDKGFLISLQAFDRDKESQNYHVLMDRIGICVYDKEQNKPNYFDIMEVTNLDLPLGKRDLNMLYNLIVTKAK